MASLVRTSTFLLQRSKNSTFGNSLLFTRGLKRVQLYKKKKNRKPKERDGKKTTSDHLYWEKYFSDNPAILLERESVNLKNSSGIEGKNPLTAKNVYNTLTSGDKRYAINKC